MKVHINLGELKKLGKGSINQFIMLEKTMFLARVLRGDLSGMSSANKPKT